MCVYSYLTVTLGSCVTPQVITALVPLITLWSCGGVVIRVRAVETKISKKGEHSLQNVLPEENNTANTTT